MTPFGMLRAGSHRYSRLVLQQSELLYPTPALELPLAVCCFGLSEWAFSIEKLRPDMLLHPMFQVGGYSNI